jgi:hypothetical protein
VISPRYEQAINPWLLPRWRPPTLLAFKMRFVVNAVIFMKVSLEHVIMRIAGPLAGLSRRSGAGVAGTCL